MKWLLSLPLAALLIITSGCGQALQVIDSIERPPVIAPPQANANAPLDWETERSIGGAIALDAFVTQGPRYSNEALQRYVTLVGLSLARYTDRPDLPFRFAVVDSAAPRAWSTPGGYVFITTGFLRILEDEAQLAGVLAHEMANVNQGHLVTMLRRRNLATGNAAQVAALTGGQAAAFRGSVNASREILFQAGLDRQMIFTADQLALETIAAAGYDPTGLERALTRLAASGATTGWMSGTHPAAEDRIRRLQGARGVDFAGLQGVTVAERFQRSIPSGLR